MPAQIKLDPGPPNALWNSDGIRLRNRQENNLQTIGAHVNPVSGQSYFTYVKVTNTGSAAFGPCRCRTLGPWGPVTSFIDTFTPTWPVLAPDGKSQLTYIQSGDQFQLEDTSGTRIAGPWFFHGKPATSPQTGLQSFWAWSKDGLFYAVVVRDLQASGGGGTWSLEVCASRQYTRADGTRLIPRGSIYNASGDSTASNVIAGVNLGWNAASTCLQLAAPLMQGQSLTQKNLTLVCPYADSTSNMAPNYPWPTLDTNPSKLNPDLGGWDFFHSPCGGLFALVPKPISGTLSARLGLEILDTNRTLRLITQRRDNSQAGGPAQVNSNATGATLNTVSPGKRGIQLTQMSPTEIDNPECSAGVPGTVNVRRVRVSTNPNQNDYMEVGQASAAVWPNSFLWVELPSLQWINPAGSPGQIHYCLRAMGDAAPDDPSPGWANADLNDRHFAQRNIFFA